METSKETTAKKATSKAAGAASLAKALTEIMESKNCTKDAAMSFLASYWFDSTAKMNAAIGNENLKNSPKASVTMKLDKYMSAIEAYNDTVNKNSKIHYGTPAMISNLTGCNVSQRVVKSLKAGNVDADGKQVTYNAGVSIPDYLEANAAILEAKFKGIQPLDPKAKTNEANEQRKAQTKKIKQILLAAGLGSLFPKLNKLND